MKRTLLLCLMLILVATLSATAALFRPMDRLQRPIENAGMLFRTAPNQNNWSWVTWTDGTNVFVYQINSLVSTHILFTAKQVYEVVVTGWRIFFVTRGYNPYTGHWEMVLVAVDRASGNNYIVATNTSGNFGEIAVSPSGNRVAYMSDWVVYTQDVTDMENVGDPKPIDGTVYDTAGHPYWVDETTLRYDYCPAKGNQYIKSADVSDPDNPVLEDYYKMPDMSIWGPSEASGTLIINGRDGWIYAIGRNKRPQPVCQGFFAKLDPASHGRRIVYEAIQIGQPIYIGQAIAVGHSWRTQIISGAGCINPGFQQP